MPQPVLATAITTAVSKVTGWKAGTKITLQTTIARTIPAIRKDLDLAALEVPARPVAKAPVLAVARAPARAVAKAPVPVAARVPVRAVAKAPVPAAAKAPVRVAARAPVRELEEVPSGKPLRCFQPIMVNRMTPRAAKMWSMPVARVGPLAPEVAG